MKEYLFIFLIFLIVIFVVPSSLHASGDDFCPPYEERCSFQPLFNLCSGSRIVKKMKGNFTMGVIYLSQLKEEQLPQMYVHLLNGNLSGKELDFLNYHKSLDNQFNPGPPDDYSLNYINTWFRGQLNYYLDDSNYADIKFVYPEKVLYIPPEFFGDMKALLDIVQNESQVMRTADIIIVIAFNLLGSETLTGSMQSFSGQSIYVNDRLLPVAWVNLRIIPPFCNITSVPYYPNCRFNSKGVNCMELSCSPEYLCLRDPSSCKAPLDIWGASYIVTHELLHIFGAQDHNDREPSGEPGYRSCAEFDEKYMQRSSISGCHYTTCAVSSVTGAGSLLCSNLCEKEAREIGLRDINHDGIIEIENITQGSKGYWVKFIDNKFLLLFVIVILILLVFVIIMIRKSKIIK